jgi:hypothetical protein
MSKSQFISKLTIITLLFAATLCVRQNNRKVTTNVNSSNPGISGEWTECVDSASVSELILKNVNNVQISLPKESTVVACTQSIKLGQHANYKVTLDFNGDQCEFNLNSKFVTHEKRAPTAATLESFKADAVNCNDKIAMRKLREIVVKVEETQIVNNEIDVVDTPVITQKLMAGLTGETVNCSDNDEVAALFMKNARALNVAAFKYFTIVECNQQFKVGQYAKYQLSIEINGEECDFFMHSLASNFNKRKPVKSNQDSFIAEFKECSRKLSKAAEVVNSLRRKVDQGVVELIEEIQNNVSEVENVIPVQEPVGLEDNNKNTDLLEIITEEIAERVVAIAKQENKLPGLTGEATDCINQDTVAELFAKNAQKLNLALTTGYTVVECKQAIKLGKYYNYAILLDYEGQQCELYLESNQIVFNKRVPTKATKQQFLDHVKKCNDLVAVSSQGSFDEVSDNMAIDNSEITDLIQFINKEIDTAEQLENLYEEINTNYQVEMDSNMHQLFIDNTPMNLEIFEVVERVFEQPLMIKEQSDIDEMSSNNSSITSEFDEDMFERENNLFGLSGAANDADWTTAAHMFAQLVVADMLQGKVVYKQNVLESKTQVFAGIMTSAVFSFDGVVCELKAFKAPRADAHLQIYHDGVSVGDQNSVFLPTLEFAQYSYNNCLDIFGTETASFLMNNA